MGDIIDGRDAHLDRIYLVVLAQKNQLPSANYSARGELFGQVYSQMITKWIPETDNF